MTLTALLAAVALSSSPTPTSLSCTFGVVWVDAVPKGDVLVWDVAQGSGAETAGLRPEDRIVSVDSVEPDSYSDATALLLKRPCACHDVQVERGSEKVHLACLQGKPGSADPHLSSRALLRHPLLRVRRERGQDSVLFLHGGKLGDYLGRALGGDPRDAVVELFSLQAAGQVHLAGPAAASRPEIADVPANQSLLLTTSVPPPGAYVLKPGWHLELIAIEAASRRSAWLKVGGEIRVVHDGDSLGPDVTVARVAERCVSVSLGAELRELCLQEPHER